MVSPWGCEKSMKTSTGRPSRVGCIGLPGQRSNLTCLNTTANGAHQFKMCSVLYSCSTSCSCNFYSNVNQHCELAPETGACLYTANGRTKWTEVFDTFTAFFVTKLFSLLCLLSRLPVSTPVQKGNLFSLNKSKRRHLYSISVEILPRTQYINIYTYILCRLPLIVTHARSVTFL